MEGMSSDGGRHAFSFLGIVNFLTAVGNLGLVSVMPLIGRSVGMPDFLVASVFSLSALTWAVSSPFWTKRVAGAGPNRFVRAGLVGVIVSMAGCAGAVALGVKGNITPLECFLGFFILRAIFGFLGAASAIAIQTLVALRTEGAERTRVLTALAGALSLGTIVGPAVAPMAIVPPLGLTGPMVFFALLGVVALSGTWFFLPPETSQLETCNADRVKPHHSSMRDVWQQNECGSVLTYGLLMCSAQAINLYTIGFILLDRSDSGPLVAQHHIGLTMMGGAVAALAAQWALPRFATLLPMSMITGGTILALLGNAIALTSGTEMAAAIGFVIGCFGYGLARPGFTALASLRGGREDQVAIASAVTLIAGASIMLPPVLATAGYESWDGAPFTLAILFLLMGVVALSWRTIVYGKR